MTLYIGVDFHPHQQTVCLVDTETGDMRTVDLKHDLEKVREFYRSLPEPAVIGVEASAKARWFENMITDTGHKLFVGKPVLIRKRATSRHTNDRRDAELILELLMRDEFPSLWRRHRESDQVLEILRLRQSLVSQRTQVYNRLTALAMVHTVGDVSRFSRLAKQVTGFVGLDPLERSSAGKVRFGSISKAGSPLLRYQLGMSALIATRFDARLKSFYKRLAKKKP